MNIEGYFLKIYSHPVSKFDIKDPVLLYCNSYNCCIIDKKDIGRYTNAVMVNDIFQFHLTRYQSQILIYPFLNWESQETHNRYYTANIHNLYVLKFFIDQTYHTSAVIIKLNLDTFGNYTLDYYINKNSITNVMQNRKDPKEYYVKKAFEKIKSMNIINRCNMELKSILNNLPINNKVNSNYQDLLNESFQLYDYQLNDIMWLDSIKNKVDRGDNVVSYEYNPSTLFDFYKDEKNCIYYKDRFIYDVKSNNITKTFKFYGGNLISSMGLGKSIVMLCFLLKDQNTEFDQYIKNVERLDCNYFYKRGKKKGSHCNKILNKTSKLFCTEHRKTPFIDKKVFEYDNLEFFELSDYLYINSNYKKMYKTNSNIIICPTHLCDQWLKEYYTHFNVERRILIVVTSDQYNNLTFGDILFSDIIIVSYNFLLNKKKHTYKHQNLHLDLTNMEKLKILSSKNFSLNDFLFKNKVLDESHEIILKNAQLLENIIYDIKSNYSWNVSGTPFANGIEGFLHNLSYISDIDYSYNLKVKMDKWYLSNFLDNGINENLIQKCLILFRRNTKESIKNERGSNIIDNILKLLTFSNPERNIYDSYLQGNTDKNYNFLIKLCCDPEINIETQNVIKNCKTLDEIQNVLLNHNYTKLNTSDLKIQGIEHSITYFQNEIKNVGIDSDEYNIYKIEIANNRRNLTIEKKNYDTIKRTYDYLKNVINTIQVSETCPICLDDTSENNLAITKCGHKFCWDCINEYLEETRSYNTKCPKCNVFIKLNQIFFLKDLVSSKYSFIQYQQNL